jgi:hypothetical protein
LSILKVGLEALQRIPAKMAFFSIQLELCLAVMKRHPSLLFCACQILCRFEFYFNDEWNARSVDSLLDAGVATIVEELATSSTSAQELDAMSALLSVKSTCLLLDWQTRVGAFRKHGIVDATNKVSRAAVARSSTTLAGAAVLVSRNSCRMPRFTVSSLSSSFSGIVFRS